MAAPLETNHYEVVVCGPDLPGLITAALIARRGHRVLLCGHDAAPPTFTTAGFTLARRPGVLPPVDAEPIARTLRELNYAPIVRRRAPATFPAVQFLLSTTKLDVPATEELLRQELQRAFPFDGATIADGLAHAHTLASTLDPLLASELTLPPHGFWDRREVARIEAQLPATGEDPLGALAPAHPFRACHQAFAALTCALTPAQLGPLARARAFDVARRGCHRLEGGWPALRSLFEDKLETFSGEVRARATPMGVVARRGRIQGLRLGPRDEVVGLDHLVWAGPVSSLSRLLGDSTSKKLRELAGQVRPAYYRYTLCLLVRPHALLGVVGPRALALADPARPPIEDNAFLITVGTPSPRDPDRIPLWVECLVAATEVENGPAYLALVRARVRARLNALLPFLDLNLVVLASPHDGLAPEVPQRDELDGAASPIPAVPMEPVASCDLARMLEIGGAAHATGIKNVFLASREVLPGLSAEGDFVTAHGAVRLLEASLPRRVHRRRDIVIHDA